LGVYDFVKRINIIRFSRPMLEALGPKTMLLAHTEGLAGHAESIRLRLEQNDESGNSGSGI
jgi:histidinol dehydrogenase